jgi:hypothetical protein
MQTWLNSSVVAAVVGVLGTGVLGALVSARIQNTSKQNELALASARETREARAAIVGRILEVVGRNLSATDDLLVTVNNAYAAGRMPVEDRPRLAAWKEALAERRDKSDSEWRELRRSLGYALVYRFGGSQPVRTAWQDLVVSSDRFEQCTNAWYSAHARIGSDLTILQVCVTERQGYESAVERLTTVVHEPVSEP